MGSSKVVKLIKPSLFILVLMVSIGPFGDTEYTPSLPRIAHSFGVNYNWVQLTMTTYLFGYALSQLLYGPFSDRFGRKPVMIVGSLIFVLGSFICVMSSDIFQLIGGRFVQGVGACAGSVISSAVVRDAFDEKERGKVFAKVNAAFAIAPGVGPIVGSFVDHLYGWHMNFFILLVLSTLLFFSVWWALPETNHDRNIKALKPLTFLHNYAVLLREAYYVPYALVMGLCIGVVYSALVAAPDLVINVLHLPSYMVIVIALGVLLGFIIGSVTCNFLVGHMSSNHIIFAGLCIMLFGALLMSALALTGFVSQSLYAALLPIVVMFAGIAFVIPIGMSEALMPFAHVAGTASAMLGFFQMGMASLSTGVMSILHHSSVFDMPVMFTGLSLLAMVMFVAFITCRPGRKREVI